MQQPETFELIELDPLFDENGWRGVRCALNGIPAAPFQYHKSVYDQFPKEQDWLAYLKRQTRAMIDRGLIQGREHQEIAA